MFSGQPSGRRQYCKPANNLRQEWNGHVRLVCLGSQAPPGMDSVGVSALTSMLWTSNYGRAWEAEHGLTRRIHSPDD